MIYNVKTLGQVFTPRHIVDYMISLIQNTNKDAKVLEPSCGNGAFLNALPHATGVDIDPLHAPKGAIVGDFFDVITTTLQSRTYDTIIGNPPFVRFQDIHPHTKALLNTTRFDKRTNLYVFFIDACIDLLHDGGELIFINPRDFLKATHAQSLNKRLIEEGSFTFIQDLGDTSVFPGFAPNCIIMRWQKGLDKNTLDDGRHILFNEGTITFASQKQEGIRLGDIFTVRVGGVSGMDNAFLSDPSHPDAKPFAWSKTRDTNKPRWMIWADESPHHPQGFINHKEALMRRKARHFGEKNWWHWIRKPPSFLKDPAILVNAKTRRKNPFYPCQNMWVDGAVLALYPKCQIDTHIMSQALNEVDWRDLGFMSGERYLFSQRTLSSVILPKSLFT